MSTSFEASTLLLDTGPLIALVNRRDRNYTWIRDLLAGYRGRLATCESVISEAWFLAQTRLDPPAQLLVLLERLPIDVLQAWRPRTYELMKKYAGQPMAVADACLIVLAELDEGRVVVTTDSRDFSVYRMRRNKQVPTLQPPT